MEAFAGDDFLLPLLLLIDLIFKRAAVIKVQFTEVCFLYCGCLKLTSGLVISHQYFNFCGVALKLYIINV